MGGEAAAGRRRARPVGAAAATAGLALALAAVRPLPATGGGGEAPLHLDCRVAAAAGPSEAVPFDGAGFCAALAAALRHEAGLRVSLQPPPPGARQARLRLRLIDRHHAAVTLESGGARRALRLSAVDGRLSAAAAAALVLPLVRLLG